MRRKSERTASKKANASPEKKVEKVKRTRTRRKKQSSSSENESVEEKSSPVREVEKAVEPEQKPPQTPVKEDSPEDGPDQVWQVKTASDGSGDVGEIQKLKICLTRPPSTPERVDRSPRSRRKHSRATSSSDTPSVEAVETRRKTRHRARRGRESKDEADKVQDSQGEEMDAEAEVPPIPTITEDEVTQSQPDTVENVIETPMSTTNEESKQDEQDSVEKVESTVEVVGQVESTESEVENKTSVADTTVVSPEAETTEQQPTTLNDPPENVDQTEEPTDTVVEKDFPAQENNEILDKSEVLEIHADESRLESPEKDVIKGEAKRDATAEDIAAQELEVSNTEDKTDSKEQESTTDNSDKATNETGVVENSGNEMGSRKKSTDSIKETSDTNIGQQSDQEPEGQADKKPEHSDSFTPSQDETVHNGQAAPIVVNRKRRWGSRPSKVTTQKSITISTDILKDIIPDVKPVEFEEVIEERKHKRIEVMEKPERPVLPKIVIDNTENMELHNKHLDEKDTMKPRESHLGANRKISIVKDHDNILARPPSPPKHKQSCILYITNLVRPFTLPQLKNLLQRTGRIVENGFWIDRIKSKCFVIYETEDQAVETRHALHGVTWPVSNPKSLHVDFSNQEAFDKAKLNEDSDNAQTSTIPGTVEDWLREQDLKRERGEIQDKPWERKAAMREWDVGKNEKDKDKEKEKEKVRRDGRDERPTDKRRHRTPVPDRSPEPARKFKKKEEEAPAKLLDDLFRKTKTTPCIYWLPLSSETIAIKEEQRRQHMAEHERRLQELRRTHRRH